MKDNLTYINTTGFADFCGGSEFWNLTRLINNSWPEFTPCFRYTALVWGPCGWLWLTTPVNIHYLYTHRLKERLRSSKRNIAKIFVCLVLSLLSMLEAFVGRHESLDGIHIFTAVYVSCGVKAATFVLAAVLTLLARVSGVTSSCVLFIFWFLTLCAHVIPLYTLFIQEVADNSFILFAIFIFSFTFIAIQFFLHCVSESRGDHSHSSTQSGQRPENPEHNASFPSKVTFHWVTRSDFHNLCYQKVQC